MHSFPGIGKKPVGQCAFVTIIIKRLMDITGQHVFRRKRANLKEKLLHFYLSQDGSEWVKIIEKENIYCVREAQQYRINITI